MRAPAKALIGFLPFLFAIQSAAAQNEGPSAGTWGAEASVGGVANLLKFRSPSSAWLFGLNGFAAFRNSDNASFDGSNGYLTARVGRRNYRAVNEKVRPFSTIAFTGSIQGGDGFSRSWSIGPALEMGTAYLFSSHVSLGASAELAAQYENRGGSLTSNGVSLSFSGLRLLGAVYF